MKGGVDGGGEGRRSGGRQGLSGGSLRGEITLVRLPHLAPS